MTDRISVLPLLFSICSTRIGRYDKPEKCTFGRVAELNGGKVLLCAGQAVLRRTHRGGKKQFVAVTNPIVKQAASAG
jgi:hypothetical protein